MGKRERGRAYVSCSRHQCISASRVPAAARLSQLVALSRSVSAVVCSVRHLPGTRGEKDQGEGESRWYAKQVVKRQTCERECQGERDKKPEGELRLGSSSNQNTAREPDRPEHSEWSGSVGGKMDCC